jgi:hypothetical protein
MAGDKCPSCGGTLHLPPTDWGKIYTVLVSHTTLDYFKIGNLTVPALHAILENLPDQIKIKRMPYFGGGSGEDDLEQEEKPYTVDDAYAALAMFSGF